MYKDLQRHPSNLCLSNNNELPSTRPIQILITNNQILPESLTLNGWFKFETAVGIVQRHSLNSLNAVSELETFV